MNHCLPLLVCVVDRLFLSCGVKKTVDWSVADIIVGHITPRESAICYVLLVRNVTNNNNNEKKTQFIFLSLLPCDFCSNIPFEPPIASRALSSYSLLMLFLHFLCFCPLLFSILRIVSSLSFHFLCVFISFILTVQNFIFGRFFFSKPTCF